MLPRVPITEGVVFRPRDATRSFPFYASLTADKFVWKNSPTHSAQPTQRGYELGQVRLLEVARVQHSQVGDVMHIHLKDGRVVSFCAQDGAKPWVQAINMYSKHRQAIEAAKVARWVAESPTEEELQIRFDTRVGSRYDECMRYVDLRVQHRMKASETALRLKTEESLMHGPDPFLWTAHPDEEAYYDRLVSHHGAYANMLNEEYLRVKAKQRQHWYNEHGQQKAHNALQFHTSVV
jgi:hypothetical protein